MNCAKIEGFGITLLLEGELGRVRGQLRSTAAVDSSFEFGRFDIPWRVLARVLGHSSLSFSSPFGFVLLRRCGHIVELCYANDIANEYGIAEVSLVEYRQILHRLRSTRRKTRLSSPVVPTRL